MNFVLTETGKVEQWKIVMSRLKKKISDLITDLLQHDDVARWSEMAGWDFPIVDIMIINSLVWDNNKVSQVM